MERISLVLQQELHDAQVSASARQAQGGVVIVARVLVHIRPLADEELGGAKVARPHGLHEGRAAALGLVLQLRTVVEQQVRHVGVAPLAGEAERGVAGRGLGIHFGPGL